MTLQFTAGKPKRQFSAAGRIDHNTTRELYDWARGRGYRGMQMADVPMPAYAVQWLLPPNVLVDGLRNNVAVDRYCTVSFVLRQRRSKSMVLVQHRTTLTALLPAAMLEEVWATDYVQGGLVAVHRLHRLMQQSGSLSLSPCATRTARFGCDWGMRDVAADFRLRFC